jgi:hypothetical protein
MTFAEFIVGMVVMFIGVVFIAWVLCIIGIGIFRTLEK